jgi:sulfide dehydrogenase cytochrome subunit
MWGTIRISAAAQAVAALLLACSGAAHAQMGVELLASNCFSCHGPQGQSTGNIPKLTSLSAANIADKFRAFKDDKTPSTIMSRIAKGYTDEQINAISAYIEKQGKAR